MAKEDVLTEPEDVLDEEEVDEELDDVDLEDANELEDVIDDEIVDDEDDENPDVPAGETETEALEELEAEELELLEEEAAEALLVDEVAELRAIRREELTMNLDAQQAQTDEFVCSSCFLVKRTSQLANRRRMICTDCAS